MTVFSKSWQRAVRAGADAFVSVLSAIAGHATPVQHPSRQRVPAGGPSRATDLRDLIYELLDAHYDTAMLAGELASDPQWSAHLGYLSELQRVGRERLAETSMEPAA